MNTNLWKVVVGGSQNHDARGVAKTWAVMITEDRSLIAGNIFESEDDANAAGRLVTILVDRHNELIKAFKEKK